MSTNPSAARAAPSTSSPLIPTGSLNSRDFAPFGQVIQNPAHHGQPTRLTKVIANQGTATKWLDVTNMTNWYAGNAPSGKPAKTVLNMFVCKPRKLEERDGGKKVFPVRILERHPYTPQTFIPMGVKAADKEARYLVIVAPTLKSSRAEERARPYPAEKPKTAGKSMKDRLFGARPNPYTNDHAATTTPDAITHTGTEMQPKGSAGPDLDNIRAFIARGDQAVTYGPGTWHAPMVVLGQEEIDFVVVQYANGVGLEDCQEHDITADIAVDINEGDEEASGPGVTRAKL